MIELNSSNLRDVCPPLRDITIDHGFVRGILEGLTPGRVWVDNLAEPRAAHALLHYGMSLIWGPAVDTVIAPLTEHLQRGQYRTRDEWLQIDPRWTDLEWDRRLSVVADNAPAQGPQTKRFTRVNFSFDAQAFHASHGEPELPSGWSLRAMIEDDFALSDINVSPSEFWLSAGQFLENGGGICAVKQGTVGAIAFASFRIDNTLEIGIETRSPYQGQGLACATAVALIRRCLDQNLEPVWSCRKENAASFLLAQKLGFAVTREIPYYRLPARSL